MTDFGITTNFALGSVDLLMANEAFRAPESLRGEPVDQRCDYFSLGALLVFLATGRPPPIDLDKNGLDCRSGATMGISVLARTLMHPRAEKRPNSWREVIQLLENIKNNYPFEVENYKNTIKIDFTSDLSRNKLFDEIDLQQNNYLPEYSYKDILRGQMIESLGGSTAGAAVNIEEGSVIAGYYRVNKLCSGDFYFSLYEVEDIVLRRRLLLKLISGHGMQFPLVRERLRIESILLSSLDHRIYPSVIGRGSWNGREYFLTDCPNGNLLTDFLQNGATLSEGQALWVAHELAAALANGYNSSQLIHRNVNPGNLMILAGEDRRLMVMDVSLAQGRMPLDSEDFASRQEILTIGVGANLAVGTPAFMSPEQVRGLSPSISMDIYGIGCLLFRLISGRAPFIARNAHAMMQAHLYELPPLLCLFSQVTQATSQLVKKCLAKDPSHRPKSYDDLIRSLQMCNSCLNIEKKRKANEFTTRQFVRPVTSRFNNPQAS